jgi:hypothetical protein
MRIRRLAACLAAAVILLAACASGGEASSTTPPTTQTSGGRPSSPAVLKILEPKNDAVVPASGATMKVSLEHATLVPATTTDITPTEGHLHVLVDDQLISMTSGLEQTLPDLTPGTHVLRVEFVASDHAPFDPRVVTQAVFQVK